MFMEAQSNSHKSKIQMVKDKFIMKSKQPAE